jgi:diguanylate cyclase (GGDEF)-like protein
MNAIQSKILIIDDSEINTALLTGLLEDDHQIIAIDNGKEGIAAAQAECPDLILLDVNMPEMDGYMVCDELKINAQTRDIPIIFVTAMDDLEDEARGLELGAIDYITKPFSPQIVKARVQNHLELKLFRDRLLKMSMVDGLTSIPNRRQFDREIEQQWQRSIRKRTPISLLMFDIDYFKQYNDIYGHLKGDDCLKKVASILSHELHRPTDLAARYGGEEFVGILPETDLQGASYVAASVIEALRDANIIHQGSKIEDYLTLSIGIVSIVPSFDNQLVDFIDSADKALYQAKQNGRNCYYIGTSLHI